MATDKKNAALLHINQRISNNLNRQRMDYAAKCSGGGKQLDEKHSSIWREFGYPTDITPDMFRFAWERHPAAKAAIDRTLEKCWETYPEIIEKNNEAEVNSPWEIAVNKEMERAFPFIKDADKKNLINRYSALLIQFNDGGKWDEPVNIQKSSKKKEKAILRYIPVWEEQIKAESFNTDKSDPNYGSVTMWTYNSAPVDSENSGAPTESTSVHPDRVLILAEGALNGSHLSGVPLLRAGYNCLIDMQKTGGGSAEGFLKNSSRQLHINYTNESVTPEMLAMQMGVEKDDLLDMFNDSVEDLNQAIDAAMFTFGAEATVLSVAAADPSPTWEVAANSFCAAITKPFTIIFGQQTGRLASDEDKADHATTAEARRNGFIDHVIESFIRDKLVAFGIVDKIPNDEFEIKWQSLLEPSEGEKLEKMLKAATANKIMVESGFGGLLTVDEIRAIGGFEALKDDLMPKDVGEGGSNDETY